MPIEHWIDHERRLVWATARGVMSDQDVFQYQCEVWSRPDVAGYNELVDMTAVERIDVPSTIRVQELAELSAAMDEPQAEAKFAIVAPDKLAYGLGRMYQTYRGMESASRKQVGVFRTLAEALAFLGVQGDLRDASPA